MRDSIVGGRSARSLLTRICHALTCFLFTASVVHAEDARPAAMEAARYAAADGATIDLLPAEKSGDVLLHVNDPGVVEMQLLVSREPGALPREMMTETMIGDAPATLLGAGDELYGVLDRDGSRVEFVVGAEGRARVARDGKPRSGPASSEDIELELVAMDFARVWSSIRKTRVTVESESISIHADPKAGPRSFSRSALLDEQGRQPLLAAAERQRGLAANAAALKKSFSN